MVSPETKRSMAASLLACLETSPVTLHMVGAHLGQAELSFLKFPTNRNEALRLSLVKGLQARSFRGCLPIRANSTVQQYHYLNNFRFSVVLKGQSERITCRSDHCNGSVRITAMAASGAAMGRFSAPCQSIAHCSTHVLRCSVTQYEFPFRANLGITSPRNESCAQSLESRMFEK